MPQSTLALLYSLRDKANEYGVNMYLTGGSARDILLTQPFQDLDILLDHDAPNFAAKVAKELFGTVKCHTQFGTATVTINDHKIDFSTARQEIYSRPGSLPDISHSSIEEDLDRRDFTINSIGICLSVDSFGYIHDPHDGLEDIQSKTLRILHPKSFIDDPTRILRAIKYEQRLKFKIDPDTYKHLIDAIESQIFNTVSGDRLRNELSSLMNEPDPVPTLLRAAQLGVFRSIHPHFGIVSQISKLSAIKKQSPFVYLAALCYNLDKHSGEVVIKSLNMPTKWTNIVRDTILIRCKEKFLSKHKISNIDIFNTLDKLSNASIEAAFHLSTSSSFSNNTSLYLKKLHQLKTLITGDDLINIGVPKGPLIGEILHQVQTSNLENMGSSKTEQLLLAKQLAERLSAEH